MTDLDTDSTVHEDDTSTCVSSSDSSPLNAYSSIIVMPPSSHCFITFDISYCCATAFMASA